MKAARSLLHMLLLQPIQFVLYKSYPLLRGIKSDAIDSLQNLISWNIFIKHIKLTGFFFDSKIQLENAIFYSEKLIQPQKSLFFH